MWRAPLAFLLASVVSLAPGIARAQTNCEAGSGPLRSARPQSTSPEEIIQRFAANESRFKEARRNYRFTQDVTLQTLEPGIIPGRFTVDGEYRVVMDVSYDDKGKRLEHVTFAPQPTLRRIQMTPEDMEDIRNFMPFVLTAEDLPRYTLLYAGEQTVDELDTYVFDVAPKILEPGKRYFQGRVWVEQNEHAVVKTCGKTVPDIVPKTTNPKKRKRAQEDLHPKFVTYREQIDGQYWFPTYTRSDDVLNFFNESVHLREIIKYKNYERSSSKSPQTVRGTALTENKPSR